MVLKEVVDKLKKKEGIEVEFFKLVIVLFFDIYGFFFLLIILQFLEIVQFLNVFYGVIDIFFDNRDLYKVEIINDFYMVVLGEINLQIVKDNN